MKNVKTKHEINTLFTEVETTTNIIGNYKLGNQIFIQKKLLEKEPSAK